MKILTRRQALKAIATVAAISAMPAIANGMVAPSKAYEDKIMESIKTAISRCNVIRGREYNPSRDLLGIIVPFDADMESIRNRIRSIYPEAGDRLVMDKRGYHTDALVASYNLQVCHFALCTQEYAWSACDTRYWKFFDSHPISGIVA